MGCAISAVLKSSTHPVTGSFYDEVTVSDITRAYQQVERIAGDRGKLDDFRALLAREMMKRPCKSHLREVVVERLEQEA